MYICEDSEVLIGKGQQHGYKKLHFRGVWMSLVE